MAVRKLGVKFRPASLVLTYSKDSSIRQRTIPVRDISKYSDIKEVASEMRTLAGHERCVFI